MRERWRCNLEPRQSNGWNDLQEGLRNFYFRYQKEHRFEHDCKCLRTAYEGVEDFWHKNFDSIDVINLVVLGEAPLYKRERSYFYNPDSKPTNFLWRNDVQGFVKLEIDSAKADLIRTLNNLGIIVLDLFPFPLHEDTAFQYAKLAKSPEQYLELATIGKLSVWKKLDLIERKQSSSIKFVLRYRRLKLADVVVREYLVKKGLVSSENELEVISKRGGGIDQNKLHQVYRAATQESAG